MESNWEIFLLYGMISSTLILLTILCFSPSSLKKEGEPPTIILAFVGGVLWTVKGFFVLFILSWFMPIDLFGLMVGTFIGTSLWFSLEYACGAESNKLRNAIVSGLVYALWMMTVGYGTLYTIEDMNRPDPVLPTDSAWDFLEENND